MLGAAVPPAIVQAADPAPPTTPAAAQPAPAAAPAQARQGPCYEDIQKFCKDVKPGGGRVSACLEKNLAELSPGCSSFQQLTKERIAKFIQACDADIEKLCKDVDPGSGRVAACLKAKQAELSPACKAEFQASRPAAAEAAK
jgi:hypothetical protein